MAGLTLGTSTTPPFTSCTLPDRHRCEHAVIVGKTGTGKTHLLESLAMQLARKGEGFAFLDFHGDASTALISRLLELPNAEKRLVVLDPSHPTRSPGVNVLEAGTEGQRFRKSSELASILRQRWGVDAFGPRTEELLRNSLYTLASGGIPLTGLPRLLTDPEFRRSLVEVLANEDIRAYWIDRFEPLSEAMKASFREPLLNRTTGFLTEPAVRHLLGQASSTINIDDVIGQRQWLIVRLPKGQLRDHAHTIGNLVFAQFQFAALAREALPPSARTTFTLLADEVQNLAENDLETLLTEGRKFGISVITANQFWEQLPRELRGCLLSAASHICFRVSSADAHVLAGELNLERRQRLALELTALPRGDAIGRFGPDSVVRFRVPALKPAPILDIERFDELLGRFTRPRAEIEVALRREPTTASTVFRTVSRRQGEGFHDW